MNKINTSSDGKSTTGFPGELKNFKLFKNFTPLN